jgi:hypothetical protein
MATTINADTSEGLKFTSDTSGELELQSGGVTKFKIDSSGVDLTADTLDATTLNTTNVNTTSLDAEEIDTVNLNVKKGTNGDSTGQPTGDFAATVYHARNSADKNGLFIKNNWKSSGSTILEIGNDTVGGSYTPYFKVDGLGYVTSPNNVRFAAEGAAGNTTLAANAVFPFPTTYVNSGHYNTSNSRFTAPVAGDYLFTLSAYYQGNGSLVFEVNGNQIIKPLTLGAASGSETNSMQMMFQLAQGDYVTVNSRYTTSTVVYPSHSAFTGQLIG